MPALTPHDILLLFRQIDDRVHYHADWRTDNTCWHLTNGN